MKNRRLIVNAGSSVVQIIVSSISLFILYRFLLDTIGISQLGIWSLVLAVSSMVQVSDFGLSGSIVKRVADFEAVGDTRSMSRVIQTAAISMAVFSVFLIICAYFVGLYYFSFAIEGESYQAAVEVLPFAMAAFWLMMVTSIYQSGLYGCQLITNRNSILITESITHLIFCMTLAPRYGLLGLAYARVTQNAITLLMTIILLKRYIPTLPYIACCWDIKLFKGMIGYAANLQIISILVMFCDPLTKGFLGRYGSISMVGYYEMASKLVQQLRSLIVSANQVLVPEFARTKQLEPSKVSALYAASYRLMFFIATPIFGFLAVCTPLLSELWIGTIQPEFMSTIIILCVGWFINTLSVPAYYANLGTGDLKMNVAAHVVMTAINITFGYYMGKLWGGFGVVLAWSIALAFGGVILNIRYVRNNRISPITLIPKDSRLLAAACIIGPVLAYLVYTNSIKFMPGSFMKRIIFDGVGPLMLNSLIALCFIVVISLFIWCHPIRKDLVRWIFNIVSK
jgi:O-antigen/teichoic acid export membrane protein